MNSTVIAGTEPPYDKDLHAPSPMTGSISVTKASVTGAFVTPYFVSTSWKKMRWS